MPVPGLGLAVDVGLGVLVGGVAHGFGNDGVTLGVGDAWAWTGSTPISTTGSAHSPGNSVEAEIAPPAAMRVLSSWRRLTVFSNASS